MYFLTFFRSSSEWHLAFIFRNCTVLSVRFQDQRRGECMEPSLDLTFQLCDTKAAYFKNAFCGTSGAGLAFVVCS